MQNLLLRRATLVIHSVLNQQEDIRKKFLEEKARRSAPETQDMLRRARKCTSSVWLLIDMGAWHKPAAVLENKL